TRGERLEGVEIREIGEFVQEPRVVGGKQLLAAADAATGERLGSGARQRTSSTLAGVRMWRARVQAPEAHREVPEDAPPLAQGDPASAGLGTAPGIVARSSAEERDRPPVPGEGRGRLVEGRLAGDEERRVPELVQDDVGDHHRRLVRGRREQRVREPAERAEGERLPDVDVEVVRRERSGGGVRRLALEETTIRKASDERVAPEVGLETV